jgi:hypothetical protein
MATANLLQTSVSGGTANALALQGDGVFLPKASTTSRLALTLTATDKGFVVYDTTDSNIYFWNGTAWESIPGSGDAGANGSVQYNDNGTVSGATNFSYDKATGLVTGIRYISTSSNAALPSFAVSAGNGIYNSGANQVGIAINGANAGTLNSTGNLVLKGGTVGANGVGVTFPATQVASSDANCLDDYEEGAWTPTSTTGINLTAIVPLLAKYTKVGGVVTLSGYFSATVTVGGLLTYFSFVGLPFAVTLGQAGSLYEDVTLKVGFSQVNINDLNGFFAAGTALAAGSRQFTYTITYQV